MSKVHQALKKAERERMISGIDMDDIDFQDISDRSSFDEHLVSFLAPKSAAAEQYRKLRTRISHFLDSRLRTILITSSTSQEGKSLTAANLAITIAQGIDQHVLLVDGDLRQPSLPKFFGLYPRYGLTDYLTGNIDLSQILFDTGIPKLKLLPSGSPSDRSSELIASNKMRNLIQELKSRYEDRYIIIDSTPIIGTDEPDILTKQVDGVILVVKAGKTPKEIIESTLSALNVDNVLGIVFNGLEYAVKRVNYGYYQESSQYVGE